MAEWSATWGRIIAIGIAVLTGAVPLAAQSHDSTQSVNRKLVPFPSSAQARDSVHVHLLVPHAPRSSLTRGRAMQAPGSYEVRSVRNPTRSGKSLSDAAGDIPQRSPEGVALIAAGATLLFTGSLIEGTAGQLVMVGGAAAIGVGVYRLVR